jgi:hypothetical protein
MQPATIKNINSLIKRKIFRNALPPLSLLMGQTIPLAVKCIHLFSWVKNLPPVVLCKREQAGSFGSISSTLYRSGLLGRSGFFMAIKMTNW